MRDWRTEIVRMVQIKSAIQDADHDGLWEYHLPRVAATEDELRVVEAQLGVRLDAQYREFLSFANGWPSFFQSVDLFGTDDLAGGPRMEIANEMLNAMEPSVFEQAGVTRIAVVPIAVTTVDLDVFVMRVLDQHLASPVIWLAGDEIDRFASFDQYFVAMLAYNERELAALSDNRGPEPEV